MRRGVARGAEGGALVETPRARLALLALVAQRAELQQARHARREGGRSRRRDERVCRMEASGSRRGVFGFRTDGRAKRFARLSGTRFLSQSLAGRSLWCEFHDGAGV